MRVELATEDTGETGKEKNNFPLGLRGFVSLITQHFSLFPLYPSWQEATAGGLWLLGVAVITVLGQKLPFPERVIFWIILLAGLGIVLRRFWLWLLGPLFFYDLVRTARRNRLIPIRVVYATTLMALLLYFANKFAPGVDVAKNLLEPESLPPNRLAKVANAFFSLFVLVQFIGVFALVPIFTAGAIVEEKERRSYDLLLTTGLTNWEIVFGLLASRLANMGLVLLSGLPILCFLEFLGGIEPESIFGNFVLTGLLLLNLGCLSILTSAYAQSTLASILKSYLYSWLLWGCLACLPLYGLVLKPAAGGEIFQGWVWLGTASGFFSIFFLCIAVIEARQNLQGVTSPESSKGVDALQNPHALLKASSRTAPRTRLIGYFPVESFPRTYQHDDPDCHQVARTNRPPVGDSPAMWKEMYLRENRELPSAVVVMIGFGVLGIFCLGICLVCCMPYGSQLISLMSIQEAVKFLVILATGISLVPVAIAAARSITEEREKRTIDPLAVTPLTAKEILFAKWIGSIFGYRWPLAGLASFLLVATLVGAVHPVAFPALIVAWLVHAAFFTSLGLLFTIICRTTVQATILTGLTLIASVLPAFMEIEMEPIQGIVVVAMRVVSPAASFRQLAEDPFVGGIHGPHFHEFMGSTGCLVLNAPLILSLWYFNLRRFKNIVRNGQ